MKIDKFDLNKDIMIVAEIGNNHEGSFTLAEEMIHRAAEAGVNAVKFQTIVPEKLVSVTQKERIRQLKHFQLSYEEFEKLSEVAKKAGLIFLSTPFDIESAEFLNDIVPAFKISSGDNTFYPLIDLISRTGKPIILSTGLAALDEIIRTRDYIYNVWKECSLSRKFAVLHCVSAYPVASNEVNLLAIRQLQEMVCSVVGYSDHTVGIESAILSVALGARIIEKHFTIDKNYSDFHDHKLSADPDEFAVLVQKVRDVSTMLGDGNKHPQKCEEGGSKWRRSIVANRNLSKGKILSINELDWVRPGGGLDPGLETEILGKVLNRSIRKGEMIMSNDVNSKSQIYAV
jgi:N-acetylneuraminate synthase/N,N'-diacetyllegionaminate synthase